MTRQEETLNKILNKCKEKDYTLLEDFVYIKAKTKNIHLKCNKDNYDWFSSYANFISKNRGCSKCAGNILYTQDEVVNNVLNKCKEKDYTLLEDFVYIKAKTKNIHLKCNKDNYDWFSSYTDFTSGDINCAKCSKKARHTQEEVYKEVLNKCKEKDYTLLEDFVYKCKSKNIHLKCNKDGYVWFSSYGNLILNNRSCSKCSGNLKYTQKEAEDMIKNKCIEKDYTLVENFIYTKADMIIKIKCNKDNHIWRPTFANFTKNKSNCPQCCNIPRFGQDEAEKNILQRCKDIDCSLDKEFIYKNNKTRVYLKCNKDNHTWDTSYNKFINQKTDCPVCKQSKGEVRVMNYLDSNNIKYIRNWNPKDLNEVLNIPIKKFKCRLNYDFYIDDLDLVIEFQGKQHYKSVDIFGGDEILKQQIYNDNLKKEYCEKVNKKLIVISYKEIKNVKLILDENITII